MNLQDLFWLLKTQKRIIFLSLLLALLSGYVWQLRTPPQHKATSLVMIEQETQEPFLIQEGVPTRYISIYTKANMMRSALFAEEVSQRLRESWHLNLRPEVIQRSLHVSPTGGADIFAVQAFHQDPATAVKMSQEAARLFVDLRKEKVLREARDAINVIQERIRAMEGEDPSSSLLPFLKKKLEEARILEASLQPDAEILDLAKEAVPQGNPFSTFFLFASIGLLVGLTLTLARHALDQKLRTPAQISALGIPFLGSGISIPLRTAILTTRGKSFLFVQCGKENLLRDFLQALAEDLSREEARISLVAWLPLFSEAKVSSLVQQSPGQKPPPQRPPLESPPESWQPTAVHAGSSGPGPRSIRGFVLEEERARSLLSGGVEGEKRRSAPEAAVVSHLLPLPSLLSLKERRYRETLDPLSEEADILLAQSPPLDSSYPYLLAPLFDGVFLVMGQDGVEREEILQSLSQLRSAGGTPLGLVTSVRRMR